MNANLSKILQLAGEVSSVAAALVTELDTEHAFTKEQQDLHARLITGAETDLQVVRNALDASRNIVAGHKKG